MNSRLNRCSDKPSAAVGTETLLLVLLSLLNVKPFCLEILDVRVLASASNRTISDLSPPKGKDCVKKNGVRSTLKFIPGLSVCYGF